MELSPRMLLEVASMAFCFEEMMMPRSASDKTDQFERDRSVSSWHQPVSSKKRLRKIPSPRHSSGSAKYQGEIVGRHLGDFDQRKIDARRQPFHGFDIAHAPFGISPAKARIKGFVALGRMPASALEGAVEKKHPVTA